MIGQMEGNGCKEVFRWMDGVFDRVVFGQMDGLKYLYGQMKRTV